MNPRRGDHPLVRVGVAQHVEPVPPVANAMLLARQQPVDHLLVRIRTRVLKKRLLFRRARRKTDQVEIHPPQQRLLVSSPTALMPLACCSPATNTSIGLVAVLMPAGISGLVNGATAQRLLFTPSAAPAGQASAQQKHNVCRTTKQRIHGSVSRRKGTLAECLASESDYSAQRSMMSCPVRRLVMTSKFPVGPRLVSISFPGSPSRASGSSDTWECTAPRLRLPLSKNTYFL